MSKWMRARPTRQTVPAAAVNVLIDALEAIGENGEEALTRSGLSLGHAVGEIQQDENVPRAAFVRLFENCLRVFHHHCKQDLALRWLSDVNLTVKEIASRLQFSDVASFRRAFRSWTGQSPFGYRSDMASPAQPRLAGA